MKIRTLIVECRGAGTGATSTKVAAGKCYTGGPNTRSKKLNGVEDHTIRYPKNPNGGENL